MPGAYVARFVHRTFVVRVHTCRHCGEVCLSYPDLRQHLDSHLQPPVSHICTTCKKSLTRRAYLLKHSALCAPQAYVCNVCHSSLSRIWDLARHERTIRCGDPKEPEAEPKRRKIVEYLLKTLRLHQMLYRWTTSFPSDYKKPFATTGPVYARMYLEYPCRQASVNG